MQFQAFPCGPRHVGRITCSDVLENRPRNEYPIPYDHSRRMVAALQSAGVQVSYSWFPDLTHESWFNWAPEAPETLAFFARHLRSEE
jgi:hypothetical protein